MTANVFSGDHAVPATLRRLLGRSGKSRWNGRRRKVTRSSLRMLVEHLERRAVLSADAAAGCLCQSNFATLSWQGRDVEVVRDSWVMRMPQLNAATARSITDYRSDAPQVPAGWSVQDLGIGFYGVTAPGVSLADVTAWASLSGLLTLQPNLVHRKLAELPNEGPTDPPANPGFGSLWGLQNTGQAGSVDFAFLGQGPSAGTPGSDIDVTSVWAEGVTGSQDIIIAVMDDGIDYTHSDLQDNMWTRPANVPATAYGMHGWDSADNDGDVRSVNLNDSHGTHVAGTIGARGNNGMGVTGVMQEVLLYGAKVFGDGAPGAATADLIDAINRVTALRVTHGQNVVAINASLGYVGPENPALTSAIGFAGAAGILFVASAGNGGADIIGDNNDLVPSFPANTPLASVISVAASNRRDELTIFSNWGQRVHIAAPGSGIWSTVPGNAYAEFPGTSMAAPHVTGVAGLIAAAHLLQTGSLPTVQELRTAILNGADVIPTVPGVSGLTNAVTRGVVAGNRRLNAAGALESLLGAEVGVRTVRPSGREGNSGTTDVEFSIRLAKPVLVDPVTVTYTTVAGTAIAGEDYAETSGTVTFQAGEQFKIVTVPVFGDTDLEDDETFFVVLTDVVNGRFGRQRSAQYTIVNDEPPLVTITPAVAFEGTGRRSDAIFEVTVDGGAMAPVMVSYATRDGTAVARQDYVPTRGMLVFRPGETRKTIAVKVIGDRLDEADEAFYLVATARNGTLPEQSVEVPGIIIDDDSRAVSVSMIAPGVLGGEDATFRVALERTGGFGDVFPTLPAGIELPPLGIWASVGTVSQSQDRRLSRALAGTDYATIARTLRFAPGLTEHLISVPTSVVDRSKAFAMRIAGVEGARVGSATASVAILSADTELAPDVFASRQTGRNVTGWPSMRWRGWGRRR